VTATIEHQLFRQPGLASGLPKLLVDGCQVSRSRKRREDPTLPAVPTAFL
jgi:hypothetical protein